jgi:hypothetical protein
MFRYAVISAAILAASTSTHAATFTNSLPTGTLVDLSGFSNLDIVTSPNAAFTSAGIASITVDGRASGNNEFYNAGSTFGAGRGLFNTENGDLIVIDEGTTFDFGSPTFTIDFVAPVDAFGLRIADTSSGFINPIVFTLFRGGSQIDQFTSSSYTAATEFGFSDALGFDRVTVGTDGNDTDGYGIAQLTVGSQLAPVPVPPALPLMAGGFVALAALARRRR